jgi:putative DNA primase/helicase
MKSNLAYDDVLALDAEPHPDSVAATTDHASRSEAEPRYLSFGTFKMSPDGLFAEMPKGTGANRTYEPVFVASSFEVLGRVRDPKGEGWARLLRWRDDDNRIHTHAISDADLHGDLSLLCATLAGRGLKIATGRIRTQLIRYINEAAVEDRVTQVARTGWHEIDGTKVFILPHATIGSVEGETVILQATATSPFEQRGSFADWQAGVGALVSGHSRAVFGVSVGLSGPLLGLLEMEGGGFNFFGQSSRGKSTIAQASASVWGKGDSPGFVGTWRSTANGVEATAAVHSDTLLVLDELGLVDARDAASLAYQLSTGSGKTRAARDGSARPSAKWRVMVLSTGELRLSDKLREAHQRPHAGQEVRLVDIPADAGRGFGVFDHAGIGNDPQVLADAIKQAARSTYGTAGPEFVRHMISDGLDKKVAMIRAMIDAFRSKYAPSGAEGQVSRVCERFGLVAASGELAQELGIVPWTEGEAEEAAARCFQDWLNARGGSEAAEVVAAIAQVRLFIEQYGDARFEPLTGSSERPIFNRAGWRRGGGENQEWLVPHETWKAEVARGCDPKMVARVLADRGMVKRAADGFQRVEKIHGRSMRVYVVTAKIMSEPSDE